MTTSSEIGKFLGSAPVDDFNIERPCTFSRPMPNCVTFSQSDSVALTSIVQQNPRTLFIVPRFAEASMPNEISSSNPRLDFIRILREFFEPTYAPSIAESASISPNAQVAASAQIGNFVVIEDDVVIGERTRVDHNSVLKAGTTIGNDCRIGASTIIGGIGFGFEIDQSGDPLRMPHIGGVRVGDQVEIGNLCSIARGTIEDTIVANGVKIDDQVFIAHNVQIGANTLIIAGAEISGGVRIGTDVWISPQVAITNKVSIGNGSMIGIGAVVVTDIPEGVLAVGLPAKPRGPRP